MNNNEIIVATIVIGVVCFLISFIFFNKVVKLDKDIKEDKNKNSLQLVKNSNYGKFWFDNHIRTVGHIMEVNALLKLITEEGDVLKAASCGKDLHGIEGVNELTQYFIKGSESSKKLFSKIKDHDVRGVQDFAEKSLCYLDYFFTKNDLTESVSKTFSHEKEITEKYASHGKAKQRIAYLQLYLVTLDKISERCKKEAVQEKEAPSANLGAGIS